MIEGGDGTGFAVETSQRVAVGRVFFREYLDGHIAAEPLITGAKDLTHASRPEKRDDYIGTKFHSGGECH